MKKLILFILVVLIVTTMTAPAFAFTEFGVAINEEDAVRIAKTLYGECRSDKIPVEQKAAVVWCILNRLDHKDYPDTIEEIVVYSQFHGYDKDNPVTEELYALTVDVMIRWQLEKLGFIYVGRTLPHEYLFFACKDGINRFRTGYKTRDYWEWEYQNPYESGSFLSLD